MEDQGKPEIRCQDPLGSELQRAAKGNPAREPQLEAIKRVIEENREVLQRLAGS
jgi:hypothetical protein